MFSLFLCCVLFIPSLRATADVTSASWLHQSLLYTRTNAIPLSEHRILPPIQFTSRLRKMSKISQRGSGLILNKKSVCLPSPLALWMIWKSGKPNTQVTKGKILDLGESFPDSLVPQFPSLQEEVVWTSQCNDVCWETHWWLKGTTGADASRVGSISALRWLGTNNPNPWEGTCNKMTFILLGKINGLSF